MSDIDKILVLATTLWMTAMGFIIFSWIVQVRQQQIIRFIALRLNVLTKQIQVPEAVSERTSESKPEPVSVQKVVDISKDMPISAYESLTLPDTADIHFVDSHES